MKSQNVRILRDGDCNTLNFLVFNSCAGNTYGKGGFGWAFAQGQGQSMDTYLACIYHDRWKFWPAPFAKTEQLNACKYVTFQIQRSRSRLRVRATLSMMARSLQPFTWQNGFQESLPYAPWEIEAKSGQRQESSYDLPPSKEQLTSNVHNSFGLNVMRTWPTLFDGTNSPHGLPSWWQPPDKVDVLICGGTRRELH